MEVKNIVRYSVCNKKTEDGNQQKTTPPFRRFSQSKQEVLERASKISHIVKRKYIKRKEPVVIDLRTFIYSIENINTLKQEMVCEFLLSANWYEDFTHLPTINGELNWDKVWDPRLYFPNAIEMRSALTKRIVFTDEIHMKGMVQWSYRVKGRFRCPFDISAFPFDDQVLSIYVSSYWNDTVVKFRQEMTIGNNISNALSNFADSGQWELQKYILSDVSSSKGNKINGKKFSKEIREPLFQFHVHARRKYNYYLWNIASMVNMISILAFTSFSIDRSDIGKRLSVSLTLLLTVVAFKNFVSSILPKVSYLTLLDKYVLFNVAFIFLVSIENALVGTISGSFQQSLDSAFLLVSIVVYLLFQTIFLIISIRIVKKSRAKFRERYIGEFSILHTLKRASEILKLPVRNGIDKLKHIGDDEILQSASHSDQIPRKQYITHKNSVQRKFSIMTESATESMQVSSPTLFFRSVSKESGLNGSDFESEEECLQLTGKTVS